jgi:gliding motility-associated protein GldE
MSNSKRHALAIVSLNSISLDPDSFIGSSTTLTQAIQFNMPSLGAFVALALSLFFLIIGGYINAAEKAFFSISFKEINEDEKTSPVDDKLYELLEKSELLLATFRIIGHVALVAIILFLSYFFYSWIENPIHIEILKFALITIIVSSVYIPIVLPISRFFLKPEENLHFCRKNISFILLLVRFFRPFAEFLAKSSFLIGLYINKRNYNQSVEELSQAYENNDNSNDSDENNIIEGIIRFGKESAKDIMTSRVDMMVFDTKTSLQEIYEAIQENSYSRIPVYESSKDEIKGILYIKDLLPKLIEGKDFEWQSLIRPAYFVSEDKMIDDLLREFQKNKVHIAIVMDEFGGTSGLITLEDIIEEIVGEINDEYDEEERNYVQIGENEYIYEAKTPLSDFYKELDIEPETFNNIDEEVETLAGLLLWVKGEFPKQHEILTFKNYEFEVLELNERRILKIKLIIKPIQL